VNTWKDIVGCEWILISVPVLEAISGLSDYMWLQYQDASPLRWLHKMMAQPCRMFGSEHFVSYLWFRGLCCKFCLTFKK